MATLTPYVYGLRDVKIAPWTAENSYGTPIDIDAAREFTVTLLSQTDRLEGDDTIKDRFSKLIGASARLSWGQVSMEVISLLTGATRSSTADYDDAKFVENTDAPYFAVVGRVVGSAGSDLHLFLPKCKIAGDLQYQAQQNSYLIPSVDIEGVNEGDINGYARMRTFSAPTALEMPLRTTIGGL